MYRASDEYILVAEYSTFLLKFIEILRFTNLTLLQDKQQFCVKNVFLMTFFHFEWVHTLRYTYQHLSLRYIFNFSYFDTVLNITELDKKLQTVAKPQSFHQEGSSVSESSVRL